MWWAIDLLASEYGWSKKYILEQIYIDDLYYLSCEIKKRRLYEYSMQLLIAQNPYSKNPKEMFDELERLKLETEGKKLIEEFDESGFERLKLAMKSNPRIQVKD